MDKVQEKLFREYEHRLDEFHKSLRLWARFRPEAVYAIMGIQDAAFLPLFASPMASVAAGPRAQRIKGWEEGAAQSLRWLTETDSTSVRSVADADLMEEAWEFCGHASDYASIADFHILYGHGWATARVDAQPPTVTFDTPEGPGQHNALGWHEQTREQHNRGMDIAMKMNPSDIRRGQQVLGGVKHRLVDGHIELAELPQDLLVRLGEAVPFFRDLELLRLSPATDMLGFTLGDFWSFLETVTVWSQIALMRCCDCLAHGVALHECLPTQIVTDDRFVDQVATVSRLPRATVQAIFDRLTFRPGRKADILLTPFMRGEGSVCWSPIGIMKYAHQRNLLKVMSRGAKALREHAATVNGKRDRLLGRTIGEEFAEHGYQFRLDTPIGANADRTDVDVLLYQTARPSEVLIIEAKALIAPDEINEVHEATQTLLHAQDQVRHALRILAVMPDAEKQQKFKFVDWDRVTQFYGVVVTTDTEAHWSIDLKEVPVITYNSLRWRFRSRDMRYPSRFWDSCVQRSWQAREVKVEKEGHADIKVGDLAYRLPVSVVNTSTDKVGLERLGRLIDRFCRS